MSYPTFEVLIPADVRFSDLKLSRDARTFNVTFDWTPIEHLCAHNGLAVQVLRKNEGKVIDLIIGWYRHHLAKGGDKDAVMEDLLSEFFGAVTHQHFPLDPGRA